MSDLNELKRKRRRGVFLSEVGYQKLKIARSQWEQQYNFGDRYTIEQLSELTELAPNTLNKILSQNIPVDRSTLDHCFTAFGSILEDRDYQARSRREHAAQPNALGAAAIKELSGSVSGRERLVEIYTSNPLALKIVTTTIAELFAGDIDEFLAAETFMFDEIRELLDRQFDRFSTKERIVMYLLAIEREFVAWQNLQDKIFSPIPKMQLLETIETYTTLHCP